MKKEEALQILETQYPHDSVIREALETLIPEFREDENRWVPKELIEYLKQKGDYRSCWIIWLQKQIEQKPIEDIVKDITKNKESATKFLKSAGIMNDNGELAEMYRSEQKPYGQRDECKDCQANYAGSCKGTCEMKQKEQKPVNDSDFKTKLSEYMMKNRTGYSYNISSESILKMAKEELIKRGELKEQKHAWSEEDEQMLVRLLDSISIGNDYKEMRNWLLSKLKSIRPQGSKDSLQTHWKPSEEQMRELNLVTIISPELNDLYEQLKKLM